MTDPVPGQPGQPGHPGTPAPESVGGEGGTGGAGGVGLPGPRGHRGDTGAVGITGPTGEQGDTGLSGHKGSRGDPGPPGAARRPGNGHRWTWLARSLWAFTAVCVSAVVVLALVVTAASQANLDRVQTRLTQIQDAATDIQVDRAVEQAVQDCGELYQLDITIARVNRDIEEGRLFSTVVTVPVDVSPEERLRISKQAVADLNVKDAALQDALDAFIGYKALDPKPETCPHPE